MTKPDKPKKPADPDKKPRKPRPLTYAQTPGKKPWHKGRAPIAEDGVGGDSAVLAARVGMERLVKYHRLGGANWLRNLLDVIPMPPDEK